MKYAILLFVLSGCASTDVASSCIAVTQWSVNQQREIAGIERRENKATLAAFLEDYARMRDQARILPCNQ